MRLLEAIEDRTYMLHVMFLQGSLQLEEDNMDDRHDR
jgi:hypothetical protein